ncbi:MBL fold metallo-hydrolase [Aeromicrobium sp. CTD01-1L150]|uniref:MBL fold metallo-hydrolase n=1 Tax=Aeromicrobium sp. CTD01-1L150 TaxID=3341830 RepID=UPI0035C205BB
MADIAPTQIADDVFLCTGTEVNWLLVRDGRDLTLVDGGYPADAEALEASITALGLRPQDVRAALLTHAHVDHLGGLRALADRYGTRVLCHADEVPHARREYLEQAGPADVVANIWRRGMVPWTVRILRAGALSDVSLASVESAPAGQPLDLPGTPVLVPTPGHTSGHAAYLFPSVGVVATGDALATGHRLCRHVGPQLLPPMFAHARHGSPTDALAVLGSLDAGTVAPGHGPVLDLPIAFAAALAHR